MCGSLPYMAPEIIQRVKYDSVASDIWALGVILYRMLYGKLPWINRDRDTLKEKILQTDFVINDSVSSSANELISRILVKNPLKRPSIESIINDLWLSDCTFQIPTMPNSLNSSYASIARRRKQPLRRVANVLNTTARVRRGSFKKKWYIKFFSFWFSSLLDPILWLFVRFALCKDWYAGFELYFYFYLVILKLHLLYGQCFVLQDFFSLLKCNSL